MNTGHITNDIGRVIPLHKGEYSATTPYELNDCVSFQGSTYWHYKPEETIGVLPTDETVWRLMTNATDVEPYVERALQAAENAEEARDAAQSAQTGAESAKTAAQTSASNAELAAGRAESAQDAAEYARDDAKSARDDAQTAKTNAEAAKTDAEAAQTAAETAKAGAEAAKTNALASATAAYNSEQSALGAKTAAETAKTAAQSAQVAAETAKTAAEAAKTAAETAQDEAETAQAGAATSAQDAQESAEDAEAYAIGKRAGVDVPSTDPAYHNNAKYYAEQAETTTQAVKYVGQTLTDAQKEQARENINAAAPDGFYQGMGVGNAEQLISTVGVTDKVPYNFRTAGGSADIGNRLNDKIVGGTIAWNQLFTNSVTSSNGVTISNNQDGTITLNGTVNNIYISFTNLSDAMNQVHKYLYCLKILNNPDNVSFQYGLLNRSRMRTAVISTGESCVILNQTTSLAQLGKGSGLTGFAAGTVFNNVKIAVMVMDLTQMFGSTVADFIYSLEQATAGAGAAWFKKLFPKPYYKYNAGELMSVCTNAHITRGFNAWDGKVEEGNILSNGANGSSSLYNRTKNFINVVGGQSYYMNSSDDYSHFYWYDVNKNFISYQSSADKIAVAPDNAAYLRSSWSKSKVPDPANTVCINLSWSGYRNGEYETYKENVYTLSPVELRGIPKLDENNWLHFDGDTYEHDGTVTRRYGIVDLGTLNWSYTSNAQFFYVSLHGAYPFRRVDIPNIICPAYESRNYSMVTGISALDGGININGQDFSPIPRLSVKDRRYSSADTFKAAMSGVYLVYELATPTTETANPFTDPQIVDDFGTEEYVDALATAEMSPRDVEVPVGHETFYQANLRDKLQNLPANAGVDGLYLVKQAGNKQELIAYTPESELPTIQTEGTYVLKSVNGVLTWVLES